MTVKFLEHTADISFEVTSSSVEGLFSESLVALNSVLKPVSPEGKPTSPEALRHIKLDSPDQTSLLIDFLNEVHALGQVNKEVYRSVSIKNLTENSLDAEVKGEPVEKFGDNIKSVTYHGAEIKELSDGRWSVTIILDV